MSTNQTYTFHLKPARNSILVSLVAIAALVATSNSLAQAGGQTSSTGNAKIKERSLEKILGLLRSGKPQIIKELGEPIEVGAVGGPYEYGRFKIPGTEGLTVYFSAGLWYVDLPKGTTWQEAVRAFGFNPEKLKPEFYAPAGKFELIGEWEQNGAYKGTAEKIRMPGGGSKSHYKLWFAEGGAKRPDGKLVNPTSGLPVISIEFFFND